MEKKILLENFKKDWFLTRTEKKEETANWQTVIGKRASTSKTATSSTEQQTPTGEIKSSMVSLPLSPTYIQATKKYRPDQTEKKPRNWYNLNIKNMNLHLYEAFSNIHAIALATQNRTIDFQLSCLEKALTTEISTRDNKIISLEKELEEYKLSYSLTKTSADNMIQYCNPVSSEIWETKMETLENQKISELLNSLKISDLIQIRSKDFGTFLTALNATNPIAEKIKKENQVQEMIDLYLQGLTSVDTVCDFLIDLNKDPILHYFQKEQSLALIFEHPCFIVPPQAVLNYSDHLKKGIIREIYFLLNSLSHYSYILPPLIRKHFLEISSPYQVPIKVNIFSIWEEKQHLQIYPSLQLWHVQWTTESPTYAETSFKEFDITDERIYNSYLFHQKLNDLYDQATYVSYLKPIILYSQMLTINKPDKAEFLWRVLDDTEETLAQYGLEGQRKFLREEDDKLKLARTIEAMVDPSSHQE